LVPVEPEQRGQHLFCWWARRSLS